MLEMSLLKAFVAVEIRVDYHRKFLNGLQGDIFIDFITLSL